MDNYKTSKDDIVSVDDAANDKNSRVLEEPKRKKGIVDLDHVTCEIINFMDYLEKNKDMEESDEKAFVARTMELYVDNFDNYFTIFNTLLNKKNRAENLKQIIRMIETLHDVKKGKKNEDLEFLNFQKEKATEYKIPEKLWRK